MLAGDYLDVGCERSWGGLEGEEGGQRNQGAMRCGGKGFPPRLHSEDLISVPRCLGRRGGDDAPTGYASLRPAGRKAEKPVVHGSVRLRYSSRGKGNSAARFGQRRELNEQKRA